MRVKFTIAVCALLVLALGASQAYAQVGGYAVSRGIKDAVQHGKNQRVGQIVLDYDENGGNIDAGAVVTVTFGGLPITSIGTLVCMDPVMCPAGNVPTLNDDKDTLTITTTGEASGSASIDLNEVRVDVSTLDVEDEIIATISTTAPSGLIPIGQARRGTVSAAVGVVKAGLIVKVDAASRLICNLDAVDQMGTPDILTDDVPIGGAAVITVTEGFADAWEGDAALGGTSIAIVVNELPAGVRLMWPATAINFYDPDNKPDAETNAPGTVWSTLMLAAVQAEDNDGSEVVFNYVVTTDGAVDGMDKKVEGVADSFAIAITVETTAADIGVGGVADIWGILSPQPSADDGNVGSVLSYAKNPVTDPLLDMGDFLNVAECVTYLLFPYVTCSRTDEDDALLDPWTTAMAIANTTKDEGVFGLSVGATPQSGSIMLHMFPRSMMNDDGMMMMAPPSVEEVAEDLASGDTWSGTCSKFAPGFNGYIIAKAGFRQAHGVAFVLGMFEGGAGIDVAHGYLGLVIPDPEFGGDRAPAAGETLGQ